MAKIYALLMEFEKQNGCPLTALTSLFVVLLAQRDPHTRTVYIEQLLYAVEKLGDDVFEDFEDLKSFVEDMLKK